MPAIGERKLFGTYYSERGPVKIPLDDYIWCGDDIGWCQEGSLIAQEILKKMKDSTNG